MGYLTDTIIANLARNVSASSMESIACGFLNFKSERVKQIKEKHRGDPERINSDILTEWRNRSSDNTIELLAGKLYEAASAGGYINANEIKEILGISTEGADQYKKTLGAGTSTGPAPIPTASTGAAPVGSTDKDKKLTTEMILELSKRLTSKQHLLDLALKGLKMEPYVYEKHVTNTREKFTEAAYDLLQEWMHSQRNEKQAYVNMYNAIETAKLPKLLEVLEPTQ